MSSDSFTWWQTGVVYQIYPRSFKDSNGDGIGDLQGIVDKLDYLRGTPDSLNVDAIWISPIYPSPMADFGYDVANYVDIDPVFGDLATFDRLLEQAHARGLRVILDFVPNHTSDEHPWFIESRSSRMNPRHDWYIWRDAKPNGVPPNNWVSMFGGPAWTWDEQRQQYYLHLFHQKQPDLNWRNPGVKSAMMDVLRFWLNRGVDGFRIDVVGFIVKDEALRDNPLADNVANEDAISEWEHEIHLYDIDQPEVHTIIREMRKLHDANGECVMIGEVWAQPRSRWVEYYGNHNSGLHLPFNFDLLDKPWDAAAIRRSVDELEAILQDGMWPNYVLGSHDKSRLASRYGDRAVRVAAMLLLTLRGTPTLYMGDEIGMQDGEIPPERIIDPQGVNLGLEKSRDHCRTPFQWSSEPFAGFSTVEPWLPVAANYTTCNMATQIQDPTSVLSLYRQLLDLRTNTPALNRGNYTPVDVGHNACYAYVRQHEDQIRLVVLNFGGDELPVNLNHVRQQGKILLSTYLDRHDDVDLDALIIRPHEGLFISI